MLFNTKTLLSNFLMKTVQWCLNLKTDHLTPFPLRYLGPLYHLGKGGGEGKTTPLVFSRSTCPIHFKLGTYLTHHKHFQNKSKWYPKSRDSFDDVIIFEITFDVKNYFLLLLRFLKEDLLEISIK